MPSTGSVPLWHAFTERVYRLRPDHYAGQPATAQRVTDSLLWAAVALGLSSGILFVVNLLCGMPLGAAVMAFAVLLPPLAVALMRRGRTTAAIIVFASGMTLVLDGMVIINGGISSSVTHWFALVPCLLVIVLPPRQKIMALVAVVLHQLGAVWLFSNVRMPPATDFGLLSLLIDTVWSTVVALLLGLTISAFRAKMWQRMVCAENDLRTAMTPIRTEFFVIDRSRRLAVDPSARVQRWLGSARQGDDAVACAALHFPEFAEQLRLAFDGLKRGERSPESCFAQLPREHSDGTEHYECSYRLWAPEDGAPWTYMVTTLKNVTDAREQEDASLRRQALAAFLRDVQTDPLGCKQRFVATQAHVDALEHPLRAAEWTRRCEALHGLATQQQLDTFARLVRDAKGDGEGRAHELARQRIQVAWRHTQTVLRSLDEQYEQQGVRASRTEYNTLLALLERRAPLDAIAHHTAVWNATPQPQVAGV